MFTPLKEYLDFVKLGHFLASPKTTALKFLSILFSVGFSLSLLVSSCSKDPSLSNVASSVGSAQPTTSGTVVRVGYQKSATVLSLLKEKGDLEKALSAAGAKVQWSEFPAGLPILEALNAGSVDFGYTGETPPIFAQAGGTQLRYVAYDPLSPKSEAIAISNKNSSIKSVADLRGKKVGVFKGSSSHYLLVSALQSAGLKVEDVQIVSLKPAEARAAFATGKIDAWAIWDPYLAVAESAADAKILVDATGLAPNRGFYLAAQSFVDQKRDALEIVLDEVKKEAAWAKANPSEVAKFLAPSLGIDAAPLEKAEKRRDYGALPLTNEVIARQQKIADTFSQLKLIPKEVKVEDAVWQEAKAS
jgi:sulfonate transport system substrate-binding protein